MSASEQCNCANSRLFPHRARKCLLRREITTVPTAASSRDSSEVTVAEVYAEVPIALVSVVSSNEPENDLVVAEIVCDDTSIIGDAVLARPDSDYTSATAVQIAKTDEELIASFNEQLPDGDEPCNCDMYSISRHRKGKCCWMKHTMIALAVSGTVAAVVAGAVIAANNNEKDTGEKESADEMLKKGKK